MMAISEKDFVEWLKQRGLTWDEQYGYINFDSKDFQDRFWSIPDRGAQLVYFLSVVLDSLDPWEYVMICKQGATGWHYTGGETGIIESVHAQIVKSVSMPRELNGALRAEPSDSVALVTLLFNQLMFGWCMWDDVFIVPDHARQVVKTSHHDVVHVTFRTLVQAENYVKKLAAKEFHLPTEVPDGTFKRPEWMKDT